MIPYAITRRRLLIKPFALDDHEMAKASPRLRELLGAIVCQAMHDGMLEIHIGVDRESGESFMKYFGPIEYETDKRIWWDMVAPPSRCYPKMLQICMSLVAQIRDQIPIKGLIPAVRSGKRLTLYLTVKEMNSFRIAWDDEYALDRNGNRKVIDLPGRREGEEADDPDEDRVNCEAAGDAGTGEGR